MDYAVAFAILYAIIAVIFVVSLVLYNTVIGGVDFGALGQFALKAAALVAAVALVMLIPFGGWMALAVWWFGFVFLFGMEFWEAKVLVLIIWGLTFVTQIAVIAALRG